jgi:hypothetical protein
MDRYNRLYELHDAFKVSPDTKLTFAKDDIKRHDATGEIKYFSSGKLTPAEGDTPKVDKTKEYLKVLEAIKKDWDKIGLDATMLDPVIKTVKADIKAMEK